MTSNECRNLIEVKTKLGEKYRRKARLSGSQPKRIQSNAKALSYERQAARLRLELES